MSLSDLLYRNVGVDPGSTTLRVTRDSKIIFNEPSKVEISLDGKVVAIGNAISPSNQDRTIAPIDYTVADFQACEILTRHALERDLPKKKFLPPSYHFYFTIPSNVNEVDMRSYRDIAEHCGGAKVNLLLQSATSAIGMKILFEKKDFILVDIGSSKTAITIFANSLVISDSTTEFGILKLKRMIRNHCFREHKITLSDNELESLVRNIQQAWTSEKIKIHDYLIDTREISQLLSLYLQIVRDELMECIERVTGHKNIGTVIANGMYFTGGGSLIAGLCEKIVVHEKMRYTISPNPLSDNINGLVSAMSNPGDYKEYIFT